MEKETLEEAAYRLSAEKFEPKHIGFMLGVIEGAKWQSERMYSEEEVVNYFIWRQQDATRNSISSVAQANFSNKELHGKKTNQMQDMLMLEKGINWNDFTPREKRGSVIHKVEKIYMKLESGQTVQVDPTQVDPNKNNTFTRNVWQADPETPIFTQEKGYLRWKMPIAPDNYKYQY